jgi:hypothetical protein
MKFSQRSVPFFIFLLNFSTQMKAAIRMSLLHERRLPAKKAKRRHLHQSTFSLFLAMAPSEKKGHAVSLSREMKKVHGIHLKMIVV